VNLLIKMGSYAQETLAILMRRDTCMYCHVTRTLLNMPANELNYLVYRRIPAFMNT